MMPSIKQFIADKLNMLFPSAVIYDESIPQNFKEGSFLIVSDDEEYSKLLCNTYKAKLLFDIAYFPISEKVNEDCSIVKQEVLRMLASVSNYRISELKGKVVDDVLHITFYITYHEMIITEQATQMQKIQEIRRS